MIKRSIGAAAAALGLAAALGMAAAGPAAADPPAPVFEGQDLKAGQTCDANKGWTQAWERWGNGGKGGAVCIRQWMYVPALGGWAAVKWDTKVNSYVLAGGGWNAVTIPVQPVVDEPLVS